jgi:hypothetical protein
VNRALCDGLGFNVTVCDLMRQFWIKENVLGHHVKFCKILQNCATLDTEKATVHDFFAKFYDFMRHSVKFCEVL